MNNYIDQQVIFDAIYESANDLQDVLIPAYYRDLIKTLPTVQFEPHKGHWIGNDGAYICSECKCSPLDFIDTMGASYDAYIETLMKFCPNCGADMRGE